MGLDEVTQICPVPLPSWLSDSGGKGIQVIAVVHGEAQLAERWGDHGRQVVLDTSSVKVFLPGITDTTTLQAASTLCGQASWKVRGQDHASRHDVATPDMIRQLPAGFALVIRGGCAPVIRSLKMRIVGVIRRWGCAGSEEGPAGGSAGGALVCVVAWWWSVCRDLVDGGAGALLVDDVLAAGHGGDEGLGGDVVDGPGQAAGGVVDEGHGVVAEEGVGAAGELEVVGDVGGGLVGGHGGHGVSQPDPLVQGRQHAQPAASAAGWAGR